LLFKFVLLTVMVEYIHCKWHRSTHEMVLVIWEVRYNNDAFYSYIVVAN